MGISESIKDYITSTIKLIVDKPNDIFVDISVSTKTVLVQIKTAKSDTGKVIGKKGRTIDALKVLCLAIKNTKYPEDSRSVMLEILEDENSNFKFKNNY